MIKTNISFLISMGPGSFLGNVKIWAGHSLVVLEFDWTSLEFQEESWCRGEI